MTLARGYVVFAVLLVFSSPHISAAQTASRAVEPEPTDEGLMAKGVRLRREGDDAGALATFERAYALVPSPRALGQMALAHQALGHWLEAEQGLVEALRSSSDAWVARNRAYLEESLATARAHLAWLEVDCNVVGAEASIGGALPRRLPLDDAVRIPEGEVSVEVRASGYAPIHRTLKIDGGSRMHAAFAFTAPPMSAPLSNEERLESARVSVSRVAARRTIGWVTLAGAGGLALVGAAALVTRELEANIYNDDSKCGPLRGQPRSERCASNRNSVMAAQTIAIAAFVGSGVAAVASGILLGNWPSASMPATSRVGCGVAGMGVVCGGAF
jgi:hypothetical protein